MQNRKKITPECADIKKIINDEEVRKNTVMTKRSIFSYKT